MTRPSALFRALAVVGAALAFNSVGYAQPSSPPGDTSPPRKASEGLSPDLFYRLLLGDVALQRGDGALAARAYLDAAREAQDVRIAKRATEIALSSRQRAIAQEAAKLWSSLDPAAERPKQVLAALASGGDRDVEASGDEDLKLRLSRLLADTAVSGGGVGDAFLQINRLFSQQSDKKAVYRLIRELAQPYPSSPEAHFAVALAGLNVAGDDAAIASAALAEVDRALELRPDWERAALLKAELITKRSPDAAIKYLQEFVASQPTSKAAAGALAQFYVEQKRYGDARDVLQKLWDDDKSSRDLEFGVATISLQMKDYAEAERLFKDLKSASYGEPGSIDLYLAQVAEETKRYADAIERYKAVEEGDRAWLAKLRIGALLGKLGKMDEAKRWFADLPAVTIEQRVQVRQGEAQLLRDAGDVAGAYAVLQRAVVEHPDSPDLIYDLALVAERLNKIDEAEARLTKLVELKPDDAQALNALGYTLVDRTARTTEGLALIEKAHKLSPGDPFILDSMGWALFRLGRLDEAESYLKRALAERPDAEIAAHLGEVLWAKGDRDNARAVWKAQLDANPDNVVLKETVKRLAP
ncbi:MAG: tetratricopeptide repeat protein [Betaproteobacteria bacterium]|nr:MAG: tetratricopeptide repeat protein [Betaproteobacteria bacterium]TMH64452.1 MAG: tetratricopeptide repeat protein [Betaproteobacteria bacterium]